MALDIGEKRVGVAVSDPDERVATPIDAVSLGEAIRCDGAFRDIIEEWEPGLIVCGLPKSLSGEEGPQAQRIRSLAGNITKSCGIPHVFSDERLSSREARRSLRELGYDERKMRGRVDMIAASLFLQTWLDARTAD